jgi:CRISPR type III-A-associated RAMP protein Csm4
MLHSDTISGAIASAFCHIDDSSKLLSFMESYKVSSAFAYANSNFFIPKPQIKLDIGFKGVNSYVQNKRLKKFEYIDYSLFSKIASGESIVVEDTQFSNNGKFLFAGQEVSLPYKDEVMQRVVVPRMGGDATPFYFERRYFNTGCGLYFFYAIEKELEDRFKSLINWLGTTGFGTDKSVGNGLFKAEFTEIEIAENKNASRLMTLSLLCPKKEELSKEMLNKSNYALVLRGGFIAGTTVNEFRHLRKKSIYMFTEGSLFSADHLTGKIENVRPEWNDMLLHPVYKDGRVCTLPVNI